IACGSATEPTQVPDPNRPSQIYGAVRDFASNTRMSGVMIVFRSTSTPGTSYTATSAAGGEYSIALPRGAYYLEVNGETGDGIVGEVLQVRDPTQPVELFVNRSNCAGRYGVVLDNQTHRPVALARVSSGGGVDYTDRLGRYKFGRCGNRC